NLIDENDGTFEKVKLGDKEHDNESIQIGGKEKMLLQNNNVLDETPVKFKGKIFNADANRYSGKLEVLESEDIEKGEYNFEFIDKDSIVVKDYFDVKGKFVALKQTSFNPNTLKRTVNKLSVVSVNAI